MTSKNADTPAGRLEQVLEMRAPLVLVGYDEDGEEVWERDPGAGIIDDAQMLLLLESVS